MPGQLILIAEDHAAIRETLSEELGAAGYRTIEASDGGTHPRTLATRAMTTTCGSLCLGMPGAPARQGVALRSQALYHDHIHS